MERYGLKIRFNFDWRSGNRLNCDHTLNVSPPTFFNPVQLVRDFSGWDGSANDHTFSSMRFTFTFSNSCCLFLSWNVSVSASWHSLLPCWCTTCSSVNLPFNGCESQACKSRRHICHSYFQCQCFFHFFFYMFIKKWRCTYTCDIHHVNITL